MWRKLLNDWRISIAISLLFASVAGVFVWAYVQTGWIFGLLFGISFSGVAILNVVFARAERIKDITSSFEEGTSVEARKRLRKSGRSEAEIDAAEQIVAERQLANAVALKYLVGLMLDNPRDVIRAENAIRIQFGIMSRNKISLSCEFAEKTAKWVMLREFAPGLTAWLEEEGGAALQELEAGTESQLKEFLTTNFPDCSDRESVVVLLRAEPKIGEDYDRLVYMRDPVGTQ